MLTVPVLRPEVAREYAAYEAAVEEYNRQRMEEMRKPLPGAPVCMAYAHAAPRCAHVRADGTRCAAPALRGRKICYAHARMEDAGKAGLKLPALEDAGGIALAAMQVVQQMLDGKLPRRKAATALYGIQIVANVLSHKPFAVYPTNVVMEVEGEEEPENTESQSQATSVVGQEAAVAQEQPAGAQEETPVAREEEALAPADKVHPQETEAAIEANAQDPVEEVNASPQPGVEGWDWLKWEKAVTEIARGPRPARTDDAGEERTG